MKLNINSKLLLVTNADMSLNAGDVTLVNRRAESLYYELGIETVILSRTGRPSLCEGVCYRQANEINYKSIIHNIDDFNPDMIVFYGIRTYMNIKKIREYINKHNMVTKIFLDVQGVPEESIEFLGLISRLKKYPNYFVHKMILRYALNIADGAFVVSDGMINYCNNLLEKGKINKFEFIKIRCGIEDVLSNEQKINWRQNIREMLSIPQDYVVFVFSGYRMAWQKMDATIDLFTNIDRSCEKVHFCFFCNVDEEFETRLSNRFPRKNYTLKFLNKDEYFSHLSACDVGMLLRDDKTTNRVAFPNKFSDYLNSGLMVMLNSYLVEPFSILKKYNIPFINYDNGISIENILRKIEERNSNIESFYSLTEKVCNQELTYIEQIKKL